jgi:hypothetical protein
MFRNVKNQISNFKKLNLGVRWKVVMWEFDPPKARQEFVIEIGSGKFVEIR